MRVALRTDASLQIGSGHVMRCLALAARLREAGAEILFVCREHPGHMGEAIRAAGHQLALLQPPDNLSLELESDAPPHATWLGVSRQSDAEETIALLRKHGQWDWLVVDHYALDAAWEKLLRVVIKRILVLDDLADRTHDADLLLDQNLNADMEHRYVGLLAPHCASLIGPRFALLRKEFSLARAGLRTRDGQLRRLLVFFGGVDASNETGKALAAIVLWNRPDVAVDVVIGAANPHFAELAALATTLPQVRLLGPQQDMAPLMAAADLALGAGGGTMWERCCMGLPTVVMALADNQRPASETLAAQGLIIYLGTAQQVDAGLLAATLKMLAATPALLARLGSASQALVDGRGLDRVLTHLQTAPILLRPAQWRDAEEMYQWRNDTSVRRFSGQNGEIDLEQHLAWFEASLANPNRALLIGEMEGRSIGVLRYDRDAQRAMISVYLVPEAHGFGLGARLIVAGSDWVRQQWPHVVAIDAHIRKENFASLKSFAAAGYQEHWQIWTQELGEE